ncbi:hypothetical protein E3N88_25473 [Mikania micrantha]|uniref:Uncharacterized protein n=1 Tax=Mikania micrantha TaxID=192012 RepID=A0A5N6N4U3_9ASTR|nr:hypothetical protein E3N88_25473 [Mikania micrantha]
MRNVNNLIIPIITLDIAPGNIPPVGETRSYPAGSGPTVAGSMATPTGGRNSAKLTKQHCHILDGYGGRQHEAKARTQGYDVRMESRASALVS